MSGILYGLGVGPGDPELLTLKALRILKSCPVVAYPAPDHGQSFARSIVAGFLAGDQDEIPIVVPMRVERFPAAEVYDRAAEAIAARLTRGEDVAVLCEGDPFFYGSFMYLFERLAERYAVEIVPGVASPMASAARALQPIASRNDVLTVIPGPLDDAALTEKLEGVEAFVIMKLGRHFDRVKALIARLGLLDRAVYCERVTLAEERVMPLAEVSGAAPYFSMILGYRGEEPAIARRYAREAAGILAIPSNPTDRA
ncbi:precorrin-2 C(20)-methyltransferase [Jiella avicenniae]|uniref:Precorrin-2 C(20)-methyltransferase n=1 Tax=Jiella avicenniae TaxID=2907202 RepID=A0A9X1NVX0_9HYPH|nr:precorrin-2 C(20)-methyltransferase [Jiella avicenniae]MCE7026477.1 precorrin-2 C(20)-methyltransferase [Jiella avicenniae]